MSSRSRLVAGVLLILLPAVVYGGISILSLLVGAPGYTDNQLRQDLWRAGHAHAGVLLVLALVTPRYVNEATLPGAFKSFVRHSIPAAAVLFPSAFSSPSSPPRRRNPTRSSTSPTSARSRSQRGRWCWRRWHSRGSCWRSHRCGGSSRRTSG